MSEIDSSAHQWRHDGVRRKILRVQNFEGDHTDLFIEENRVVMWVDSHTRVNRRERRGLYASERSLIVIRADEAGSRKPNDFNTETLIWTFRTSDKVMLWGGRANEDSANWFEKHILLPSTRAVLVLVAADQVDAWDSFYNESVGASSRSAIQAEGGVLYAVARKRFRESV